LITDLRASRSRAERVPAAPRDEDLSLVDVAIVAESTYPFLRGVASAVVQDIVQGNPDSTFGIIHVAWDSDAPSTALYQVPPNVL
jgi:polysaccharide biosynthesis protein PelF